MNQESDQIKVLIVEDEILTARYLIEELKLSGMKPLGPISRGENVIKAIQEEKPQIIILDIRLSGSMTGIDSAVLIRQHYDIPVIFLSGDTTNAIMDEAKKIKNTAFVKKPVMFDELIQVFRQFTELKK